jgi:hypothetical protein
MMIDWPPLCSAADDGAAYSRLSSVCCAFVRFPAGPIPEITRHAPIGCCWTRRFWKGATWLNEAAAAAAGAALDTLALPSSLRFFLVGDCASLATAESISRFLLGDLCATSLRRASSSLFVSSALFLLALSSSLLSAAIEDWLLLAAAAEGPAADAGPAPAGGPLPLAPGPAFWAFFLLVGVGAIEDGAATVAAAAPALLLPRYGRSLLAGKLLGTWHFPEAIRGQLAHGFGPPLPVTQGHLNSSHILAQPQHRWVGSWRDITAAAAGAADALRLIGGVPLSGKFAG